MIFFCMDLSRVYGALFGAAAADSVGASFEGMMADESRVPEMRGGRSVLIGSAG